MKKDRVIYYLWCSFVILPLLAFSFQYNIDKFECAEKGGVMIQFHCIKKSAVIEVDND